MREEAMTVPMDHQLQCERAVVRFMRAYDFAEFEAMADLFAPDGRWVRHDGSVLAGPGALLALAQGKGTSRRVRHVLSNFVVGPGTAPDRIQVDSYVVVYAAAIPPTGAATLPPPEVMGRYTDELREIDGTWKIVHKSLNIDFDSRRPA